MATNGPHKKQKKKGSKNDGVAVPSSSKERSKPRNCWPNLPEQLIRLIASESTFSPSDLTVDREWSLMRNITSTSVTKSWRIPSHKSTHSISAGPWLELHNIPSITNGFQRVQLHQRFELGYFSWGGRWKKPEEPSTLEFLGCTHGFLVIKSLLSPSREKEMILFDPFLRLSCFLPKWSPDVPTLLPALSSSCRFLSKEQRKRKCPIVIVLTGTSCPAFAFTRLDLHGDSDWRKINCKIVDPHCTRGRWMRFSNGIWFQDRFYALSVEGTLAVVEEDVNSDLRITKLGKQRAVPDSDLAATRRRFRECLVESEGKVVLVFLCSTRSTETVDHVEVYRLELKELAWVRARSLGGAALFLGSNSCMSVSGDKLLECKGNSVYFAASGNGGGWGVYDTESGVISSCARDFGGRTDLFHGYNNSSM
ncbi:unnamed protein product [Linum trigynum]|uniref:KIB1-4 beta-propeller domain-containing protein n=1 Tax=Linum trigynum TaxID=586398 RepID=A0AAV2DKQ2_9ROSI